MSPKPYTDPHGTLTSAFSPSTARVRARARLTQRSALAHDSADKWKDVRTTGALALVQRCDMAEGGHEHDGDPQSTSARRLREAADRQVPVSTWSPMKVRDGIHCVECRRPRCIFSDRRPGASEVAGASVRAKSVASSLSGT